MKTALYARISTKDGRQDTENQLTALRQFAVTQGWTVTAEYIDRESGGTADRDAFQQMFADASRHRFDLLLFWSLDRLSREGALETLQHLNRLTTCGVGYKSFTEQYLDSCGLFKDAIISILGTLARQERVRLSERTKAGLHRVRAAGTRLGRPTLTVRHSDVAALKSAGLSNRAIGRKLAISEGSVRRLVRATA